MSQQSVTFSHLNKLKHFRVLSRNQTKDWLAHSTGDMTGDMGVLGLIPALNSEIFSSYPFTFCQKSSKTAENKDHRIGLWK